ncbi:MAG: RNA polymerase sigma-I factor [Bacillota bacterium]|jgi:RNA polymerase sigma factor
MTDKDNQISTLQAVRAGDTEARQQLLSMYTPMVIRIASGLTGRFMEIGRDEEISIGLLALNEAIDKYDSDRGASFTSFANLVISNRLRDYLRRQKGRELPASAISEQLPPLDARQAWQEFRERDIQENRRSEVLQFIEQLSAYNLDLKQLAAATPKHRQARARAAKAARILASTRQLAQHVRAKKELPLKELEGMLNVSRKTLERQRKYIIALFIIMTGDYQYLGEYLPSEVEQDG